MSTYTAESVSRAVAAAAGARGLQSPTKLARMIGHQGWRCGLHRLLRGTHVGSILTFVRIATALGLEAADFPPGKLPSRKITARLVSGDVSNRGLTRLAPGVNPNTTWRLMNGEISAMDRTGARFAALLRFLELSFRDLAVAQDPKDDEPPAGSTDGTGGGSR